MAGSSHLLVHVMTYIVPAFIIAGLYEVISYGLTAIFIRGKSPVTRTAHD